MDWERVGRDAGWVTVGLALGAAIVAGIAEAEAQDWVTVTISNTGVQYQVNMHSVESTGAISTAMFRVRWPRTGVDPRLAGQIDFERMRVFAADCERGYGAVYTLKLDYSVQYDSPFVLGGGNVISRVAEFLCLALKRETY